MYMSDTLNLANSIWPNGMKVDSDGHAVFYPLGTNKVEVPTSSAQWPKGNKLVSPFIYQDDKLVGFVDTKALKVSKTTAIYLPYTHIEADFSAINKGQLQIHAPKATTKKASWKDSGVEDIPSEVQYKYKGYTHTADIITYNHLADISSGSWTEPLFDLYHGGELFYYCSTITSFESDLPNMRTGYAMFASCANLTSFASDMGSLENGERMFYNCSALTSFASDMGSLENGQYMFSSCSALTSFDCDDLSSLTNGVWMFNYCENLSQFDTDLPKLTNSEYMFAWCDNLTSFSSKMPALDYGYEMFNHCDNLISFSSDLSSLTDGNMMFNYCCNLSQFDTDLPSLTNGILMFAYCEKLNSFNSDLHSLTNGSNMFYGCKELTSFSSDLSSLTDGERMFSNCSNLTTFSHDLSSLTDGDGMFWDCSKLTSFNSDLSSLTNGISMFQYCAKLESFSSDLSSLTLGSNMFFDCKLNTASVQNIANTINTYNGTIHIGIGNSEPNDQETEAFNTIVSKGWTVYVNGSQYTPTSPAAITTLDENGEETGTPIPFYAKPVQSDEEHAKYIDEQGNYYNILGAQFIYGDDISTYGMFTCEEDAAANMRLTPYIKPIEN